MDYKILHKLKHITHIMENKTKAIFNLALMCMNESFSSKEFCTKCRELGIEEQQIKNGISNQFLTQYCIRTEPNGRTWMAINEPTDEEINLFSPISKDFQVPSTHSSFTIEQAVELLKNNGYKILQPITEFKEL
jgi:hypothetical protein